MSDFVLNVAGAGGGGCFRAGTQIQLEHGRTIAIELLKEGDEILAFDEDGHIHVAKVTQVHYHEDPQPIMLVKFWRGEMFITPNHWVLNQYGSFVEMGRLTTHDALVDGMGHLRPITGAELVGYEPVWNLTVEPHHTFIADGIRVHNGGHRERYPEPQAVAGAGGGGGGKGGGGSRAAVEDPDSLQSRAMVGILDLVGEGQIGGLVSGAQSIYLNDTPIQNSDGSLNFTAIDVAFKNGTPLDSPFSNISDIETPYQEGVKVTVSNPHTVSVRNVDSDRLRIVVSTPSLISQDMTTGDIHGTTLQYKLSLSVNNGPYNDILAATQWQSAGSGTSGSPGYIYAGAGGQGVGAHVNLNTSNVQPTTQWDADGSLIVTQWGEATVQPQVWNGSSWVNYGDTFHLSGDSAGYVSGFVGWGWSFITALATDIWANLHTSINAPDYTQMRFVIVSGTPGVYLDFDQVITNFPIPTLTISGKVRSKYQTSHTIDLPKGATAYGVRLTRLTADSTSSALQNDLYFDTIVEITNSRLNYPNSAMAAITIDSSQFSNIPSRAYLVDGLYIQVPSNYDPSSRTYDGIWDGTFKLAVSNNPAWVLYDLLTNTRYGLGDYITPSQIDKAALYSIGKYCDESVPNGLGGWEPRFTLNTQIGTQQEAYKLISNITSCFRGMSYWAKGMVGFTQDSPADPVAIFSAANVVDGVFTYAGSARKDRHSVAHVTWNDPTDNYKQKIEYVENTEMISKYGIRKAEMLAFGCTSRGQAARAGRWLLYTEQFESDMITFKVGIDAMNVLPGNIIAIADQQRAGKKMAGRIMAASPYVIQLDAPITIGSTGAQVSIRMPDGSIATRTVLQGLGATSSLSWDSPLPTTPLVNAMFVLSEANLTPLLARVVGITQERDIGTYTITALEHNPSKYGAIERDLKLLPAKISILTGIPTKPVSISLTDHIYSSGSSILTMLDISWEDNQQGLQGWEVRIRQADGNWTSRTVNVPHYEYPNVADGLVYEVQVYAINVLNQRSPTPAAASRYIIGKAAPPSDVASFTAQFANGGVLLNWSTVSDIDLSAYEVRKGTTWEGGTRVTLINGDRYQLPSQPEGLNTWHVRALDTTGHYSVNSAIATITVVKPVAPTGLTGVIKNTLYTFSWNAVSNVQPIQGYRIKVDGVVVDQVSALSYSISANWVGTKVISVEAYDAGGNYGTAATVSATINAPVAPNSLNVTYSGDQYTLTWTAGQSDLPIESYEIRADGASWTSGATTLGNVTALTFKGRADWLGNKTFRIKAKSVMGFYSDEVTYVATITAPAAPTGMATTFSGDQYTLTWNAPTSTITIDSYEIRADGSSWTVGVTNIGIVSALIFKGLANWIGDRVFRIKAKTVTGFYGAEATLTSTIAIPSAPGNFVSSFSGDQYVLAWDAASSPITVAAYEIRSGGASWDAASVVATVSAQTFKGKVNWAGAQTFRIKAKSTTGYYGVEATVVSTVLVPATPTVTAKNFVGQNFSLVWPDCQTSLPIDSYEVREGASWSTGTMVGVQSAQSVSLIANWLGSKTYWVAAKDVSGNVGGAGSAVVTISLPNTPVVTTSISGANVVINWTDATSSIPIESYEVRIGASWATAASIGRVSGTTMTTKINWSGSTNIYVAASDVADNTGTPGSTTMNIVVAGAPSVSSSISGSQAALAWVASAGTLPIDSYDVRYGSGSYASATPVSVIKSSGLNVPINWVGDRVFQVAAVDIAGNYGAVATKTVSVSAPAAPTLTSSFLADMFNLSWTVPTSTLPIEDYEVRYGSSWASGTSLGAIKGTTYSISAQWAGTRIWWVAARDANGNVGTPASISVTITAAPAPLVTQQIVDNNVLLYWTQVQGTLPTATYEIRRGSTWATATVVGTKAGGFTTIFETVAGTYTYWVAAIDTAGNYGTPFSIGATVSQPPDYVLKANVFSTFAGTKTNMVQDYDGSWLMPVSTTETFSDHFTSRSWTTPQDQINAGYPIYIQPALVGTATYEEQMDYGAVLASSKILVTVTGVVVSGNPAITTSIKVSLDGLTWTTYSNTSQVFATNFRYVRVSVSVTAATSLDLYRMTGFNYRLDSKLKNDAGMGVAGATDAVTGSTAVINGVTVNQANPTINGVSVADGQGTLVLFNQPFIDITALELSIAAGSSARFGIYDFLDVPYMTGFKVLLYDGSGNRVGGGFSWSAKGY